jgi:hypothetical protein
MLKAIGSFVHQKIAYFCYPACKCERGGHPSYLPLLAVSKGLLAFVSSLSLAGRVVKTSIKLRS